MPKFCHLAIKTIDLEALAKFYDDVFDLKVLNRDKSGAVYMSDGFLTLALLRNRGDDPAGSINLPSSSMTPRRSPPSLVKAGVAAPTKRPAVRPYAEHRATDPDGNPFDLSVHGFQAEEYRIERDASGKEDKFKEIADA